jgi:phosphoenolpyruvate-protein phosphotransferase (PTS system enzyme I)
MIKGIAASSGIVVSKVYKLEYPDLNVEKKDATPSQEIEKLQHAITKTQDDIRSIKEKAVGKLSDEELAIFDAHLMVSEDPELVDQIKGLIEADNVNAEYATHQVASMFIGMFESMEDAYFKERAADIKDVTQRLIAHILNTPLPDLTLINEEVVIVAHDLTPSDTAQLNRQFTLGFATQVGGRTSHSAIMARSLEIPAVVGCGDALWSAKHGDAIILDAIEGKVYLNPDPSLVAEYTPKIEQFRLRKERLKSLKDAESVTLDGHHVELVGNIGTPHDVTSVLENGGEGVGLYRTEFLYMDASSLPSEEEQTLAYSKVIKDMKDKPVVVRTLDIGGDKELSYLPFPKEMNPFLGYRAIRLCLDRTDIFKTQVRALLKASAHGNLHIMFPMIATLDEFRQAKTFVEETAVELKEEGVEIGDYKLGMMVEIPAAAMLADQFAKEVDFMSIGTNDLIQYSMASDRMNEKVSYLYQPYNPSILRLIKLTIDGAHKHNKWVGMCGEMAGEPLAVPLLLGLGLDEFSMSASSILAAREIVRSVKYEDMKSLALKALECSTEEEVIQLIKENVTIPLN